MNFYAASVALLWNTAMSTGHPQAGYGVGEPVVEDNIGRPGPGAAASGPPSAPPLVASPPIIAVPPAAWGSFLATFRAIR
jgi:hypothetical protein